MKYIVSISGGLGSAEALRRAIEKFGKENIICLFADVKGTGVHDWLGMPTITKLLHERFGGESRDTYRFIWQLAHHFDIDIERLETPDSIWDIFAKRKALRIVVNKNFYCPASEDLKRAVIARWIEQSGLKEGEYMMVLGMGWAEEHRVISSQFYWRKTLNWDIDVISLNADKPIASNEETALYFMQNGVEIPSAYVNGLEHNNCGGGCTQAGQGHFANLFRARPLVYYYWAWMEKMVTRFIGHDYTILKDERGGKTKRLSLYAFIPRILKGDYRKKDLVACACMGSLEQLEVKLGIANHQIKFSFDDKND